MRDQPVADVTYGDGHQSGRFDATDVEDRAMVDQLTSKCSVAVVTEGIGLARHFPAGWGVVGRETIIAFDSDVWELLEHDIESVRTPAWKRGVSNRESVEFTWALLRHRVTGATLLRVGGHLPAHLYRRAQRAANLAALRGLGPILRRLIRDHTPDEVDLSCDFNRELRLRRNRDLIERSVRGVGMPLHLIVPPRSTLRLRKIEGFVATRGVCTMLDRRRGYDHRGIRRRSIIRHHH